MSITPLIKEKFCEVEIPTLSGVSIELDQCQFDLFMAVHIVAFVVSENPVDVICKAFCGIHHFGLAGELVVFACHFEKVACIIHLVLQYEVFPALVEAVDDEPSNQESVLLLGGENTVDDAIHSLAESGIIVVLQGDYRTLEHLI